MMSIRLSPSVYLLHHESTVNLTHPEVIREMFNYYSHNDKIKESLMMFDHGAITGFTSCHITNTVGLCYWGNTQSS